MTQLSRYVLETLWEDGDLVLSRSAGSGDSVLVLAPASEQPAPGGIARLQQTYAFREKLEPSSMARPLRLAQHRGLPALVMEDPGGNLLARLLGRPWELSPFLHVAIDVAVALSERLKGISEQISAIIMKLLSKTAEKRYPFFAIQFFTALAQEVLLAFDSGKAVWRWDLSRARAKRYTDDVVKLITQKLKRMPGTTQEALKQLACLGNSAKISSLTLVYGQSEESIQAELWDAVCAGLVFSMDGAHTFLHYRIQEAAYSLIPEIERAATHLENMAGGCGPCRMMDRAQPSSLRF